MASRGNLGTREKQDKWRENIATTQIIKRVENQALGITHYVARKKCAPMTSVDVKCAEILLNRTLPAIKQIELSGALTGSVEVTVKKYTYEK